jgi:hypothetical protein
MRERTNTEAAFTLMAAAFRDFAIDAQYRLVRAQWHRLPRHMRRRFSKDYALIQHYRARRNRGADKR